MAQWGNTDDAANSVSYAVNQFKVTANSDNQTAFFGNTTQSGIMSGVAVGQFGVAAAEASADGGPVVSITITNPGSGYTANATVTLTAVNGGASATANAQANSSYGRIAALKVSAGGSGYKSSPTVTVAAPSPITFNASGDLTHDAGFNALSGVANTTDFITTSSAHTLSDGDRVQYLVAAGNTAIGGLTNAASYYVVSANTTAFKVAATSGGDAINVTASVSETGHTLRRLDFIDIASNILQDDDIVTYKTAAGNTAVTGLANNTSYYVIGANTGGVYLSATADGARIALTPGASETGHSLTGQTATGVASVGGGKNKGVAHAGWVVRTEGSGGRAGRVQYETLVAMGSIGTDASDDTVLPDA